MLANQQHAIDGETVTAQREGFLDRGVDLHGRELAGPRAAEVAELAGPRAAEVAVGLLIDVQRDQIHRRTVVAILPAVADQVAVDDVLRVGVAAILGDHGRDA